MKSIQSCPTLCDPIDGSPPGSTVPGILQARTLEWVAISFSNAWKWKVKVKSLSRVWLFTTPWTEAYQALLSMGFSRQEYWSGVPLWQFVFWLRMTSFPALLLIFFLFETDLWVKSGRYSFTFNKYSLFHQVKILKALLTLESTGRRWSLVSLTKLSGVKMGGLVYFTCSEEFLLLLRIRGMKLAKKTRLWGVNGAVTWHVKGRLA